MPDNLIPVPQDRYTSIGNEIASDASPVGIDAKKTHIYILHLLLDIQERLNRLEERMGDDDLRRNAP